MFPKKSVILFAAGWMLLALVALPAHASAASPLQTPATVIIDTFPIFENQLTVRQAHIAWLAAKDDVEMQATLAYLPSVNGTTATLISIHEDFRQLQAHAATADSQETFDALLQDYCGITQSFRKETAIQMKVSHGIYNSLRQSTQSALAASVPVRSAEVHYWEIREQTDLADFDQRVERSGAMLTTLRGNGYEITAAQEKLTEIIAMRNELATTLNTRNNTGIERTRKKIHTASIGFAQTIRGLRINVSQDTIFRQNIEQGSAVMIRASLVNTKLKINGMNNASNERYVSAGTAQLAVAAAQLDNRNLEGAKETLLQFRSTVQSLRDSYRTILIREDLSQPVAQDVLSVAQALDITAARMLALK
ncbi:MAG: hypothetical protein Q7T80_08950 [Methanoregula sp.]|nr:hypothetical protein [Methanoregula sp.]